MTIKQTVLVGAGALALSSAILSSAMVLAQEAPADLVPPGFDDPAPTPSPSPTASAAPAPTPTQSGEVVQPTRPAPAPAPSSSQLDLSDLPSIAEIEALSTDELDQLFGLRPRIDIPPAAQRSLARIGVISPADGGLPPETLAGQPASLVRAALAGIDGPIVSRWGHILLRRALASQMRAPEGMDPIEFATLRARALNAMGEYTASRALVQSVDTAQYSPALADAAINAYVATSDIVGTCPAVRLVDSDRDDWEWVLLQGICNAYAGEETRAQNDLRRALSRGTGDRIDILLAQRYAGAAGRGRRAVTIEWDEIEEMTPWRFALANALGEEIPNRFNEGFDAYNLIGLATNPAVPLERRAYGADYAAARGILSARAMVDLYSQIYLQQDLEEPARNAAVSLREAYVDNDPAQRLAAIRSIWDAEGIDAYGRDVLTAYAAARITPSDDFQDDAGALIGSMLAAGLDRDAMRWADVVDDGSLGWALLALADPQASGMVSDGDLSDFVGNQPTDGRKAEMLLAGLAGLGRVDSAEIDEYSERLGVPIGAPTRWTQMIDRAAEVENTGLVVLLAGLGMQSASWERMTARHLYHVVSALNRVGLDAEARMIAAEAVVRA